MFIKKKLVYLSVVTITATAVLCVLPSCLSFIPNKHSWCTTLFLYWVELELYSHHMTNVYKRQFLYIIFFSIIYLSTGTFIDIPRSTSGLLASKPGVQFQTTGPPLGASVALLWLHVTKLQILYHNFSHEDWTIFYSLFSPYLIYFPNDNDCQPIKFM